MTRLRKGRPSPALVVAILALVAALAGTAVAGPGASSSAITKSKVKKIANKQITKRAPGLSVAHADTADNATNAQNAANATNAQNAANANSVDGKSASDIAMWAVVNSNGTLARGFGLTSSRDSQGEYFVTANRTIDNCAAVASPRDQAGETAIFDALGPGHTPDPQSFNIHRENSAGALIDASFSISVLC
jgi:hypothetical protein